MNKEYILPEPIRTAIITDLENSVMPAREVKSIITVLMRLAPINNVKESNENSTSI